MTKTTPLQQAIFEELEKYTSIEIMRENAQAIADTVAKRDDIASCSYTYVMRMIGRKEDKSAKIQIKVAPPTEIEEEEEESEGPDVSFSDEDAEDDWDFDEEPSEDEEESDSEESPKPVAEMPLDQILSKENVEMLISVPFRMAADFTGWDGAELTASEKKRITPMARAIMLKYVPDLMQAYFVEIVFILVVGEIVVAKYRAYNIFAEEKESKKKAQEEATKQAEIEENRRLQIEREEAAARKASETAPEIESSDTPPLTKEDAGDPSWNKAGGIGS